MKMKYGKMVVIGHFTGGGSHRWGICGCPEGHVHNQVGMVPRYPKPIDEAKKKSFLFSFFPFLVKLSKLGTRSKPGCFQERDWYQRTLRAGGL